MVCANVCANMCVKAAKSSIYTLVVRLQCCMSEKITNIIPNAIKCMQAKPRFYVFWCGARIRGALANNVRSNGNELRSTVVCLYTRTNVVHD